VEQVLYIGTVGTHSQKETRYVMLCYAML